MTCRAWLAWAAFLPLLGSGATVESAAWGPFTLDTRSPTQCLLTVGPDEAAAGAGFWDVTGAYATSVSGHPLTLYLVHDCGGKLSGSAALTLPSGKGPRVVTMPIRGNAKGTAGALLATLALQGGDAAGTTRVTLALKLALNPTARELGGTVSGSLVMSGALTPVLSQPVTLPIPAPMDGSWTLALDLTRGSRGLGGSALLRLAHGVEYVHTVAGTYAEHSAGLILTGLPAYPTARGVRLRAVIAPLEGAPTRVTSFAGTLYGQTVAW